MLADKKELANKTQSKKTYMAKVIVIGNSSVGKTSILSRFTYTGNGNYQLCHTPTIGVDFKLKTVNLPEGVMKLQLWDTAGQERFRTMTSNYYQGASGIVLVYSVTDRKSFDEISDWMYQINNKNDDNTPKIIIGNKCDVSGRNSSVSEKRVVETFEGKLIAQKYKALFMEVSAKQNINIDEAFLALSGKMLQRFVESPQRSNSVMVLDKKEVGKGGHDKAKGCC